MNFSATSSSSEVVTPGRTVRRTSSRVAATILPARAMISISLWDLSVIIADRYFPTAVFTRSAISSTVPTAGMVITSPRPRYPASVLPPPADPPHRPHRRDGVPPPAVAVPRQHRRGLAAVGREPPPDRRGIVVGAALDPAALLQARQDLRVPHVEEQPLAHPPAPLGEQRRHSPGLRQGAHDAVKDHAPRGGRLAQLLPDHAHDEVVAHQVAVLHDLLRLGAERGAPGHRVAQEVAGGEAGEAEAPREDLALGALPRSGRAEQEDIHNSLLRR